MVTISHGAVGQMQPASLWALSRYQLVHGYDWLLLTATGIYEGNCAKQWAHQYFIVKTAQAGVISDS